MKKEFGSPCIGVCELRINLCVSCHRTVEEITNWTTMSHEEKTKTIQKIKIRKLAST